MHMSCIFTVMSMHAKMHATVCVHPEFELLHAINMQAHVCVYPHTRVKFELSVTAAK